MSFIFFTGNPPSILFVVEAFLIVYSSSMGDDKLVNLGWSYIGLGVILKVFYIIAKYKVFR